MRSVTKSRVFCLRPPSPPNEPYNFLCEMAPSLEICYAYSGGRGVFFFFPCTAWWRVTIYCVWLYLGSREYWLFDLTLAERRRRIAIPTVVVERQCHSSVVAELFAPDGPFWRWAEWWLWVICHETKDAASWRHIDDDDTKVPPGFIDDWCDITELEQEKWGPALRNRLEGEAFVYKRLLDRDGLRQPNGRGVENFKRTLRPHFVKGAQTVFLYRFMNFMKNNRGNGDLMKWMTRFQTDGRRLAESWMHLLPELDLMSPVVQAEGALQRQQHNNNQAALATANDQHVTEPWTEEMEQVICDEAFRLMTKNACKTGPLKSWKTVESKNVQSSMQSWRVHSSFLRFERKVEWPMAKSNKKL